MPPQPRKPVRPVAIGTLTVLVAALGVAGFAFLALPFLEGPPLSDPVVAREETALPEYRETGGYLLVCPSSAEDFAERNEGVEYNQRIVNERLWEDECPSDGHASLGEAIAAVEEGAWRILVLPGHYSADQTIAVDHTTPGLQIEGLGDGPEDVQIAAGSGVGSVMEVSSPDQVYLTGFTLSGGAEDGLVVSGARGTVVDGVAATGNGVNGFAVHGDGVDVRDCRAEDNGNVGIALQAAVGAVEGCESSGNRVGMRVNGDVDLTVTGNRLHGNVTGLLVAGSNGSTALEATGNAIYDNNADHRAEPGSDACTPELTEPGPGSDSSSSSGGVLCADLAAPAGVGVAIAGGRGNYFWGNHIWGQRSYAIAVWSPLAEPAMGNRFEDNTLGIRDDGQRARNRHDLWWDGAGEANCFTEPTALHTAPAAMPDCADAGSDRVVGDPMRTFKTWHCGPGGLAGGIVPDSCDWFGARQTERLEFQVGVLFAASLLFLTGAGWFAAARSPAPPPGGAMSFSAMATAAGALLMVLATWSGRADYEALAIGLWGVGWLLAGRSWSSAGLRALGAATSLIGALALVDSIDRGVWIIPAIPFSPAWTWLILLPLWVILAFAAIVKRHPQLYEGPEVERTPATAPARDSFDW
ncbi:right-handed parallel beta-helix repeat-containing protein [Glycomyces buryatensis]|uniref:Right-handed parallel beta-helix repeat-containing protein n=1 Tax=Glycomyces buryatensis TaxID=2570927 RepID=A0A4S8QK76_9ACTN|nr:right-handed parallel beta-helix repeat-containing protein [Glycomyces buryatensis]THV41829.1 right-handed parallel beta-helix repeat-containing protein [Glycomyces buryatensis]